MIDQIFAGTISQLQKTGIRILSTAPENHNIEDGPYILLNEDSFTLHREEEGRKVLKVFKNDGKIHVILERQGRKELVFDPSKPHCQKYLVRHIKNDLVFYYLENPKERHSSPLKNSSNS